MSKETIGGEPILEALATNWELNMEMKADNEGQFICQFVDSNTDEILVQSSGRTIIKTLENMILRIKEM